ncbi:hypothetical protein Ctob_005878 [Chrysochromulina tobinii]|uniref:Uncharacterized protein n=1 Tax=Chrysochromulina tobinii TaxID=1460289 RepID=A0A0M0JPQ5_9EUKA|nr:hypothetical protein Ctob_005878 [Chrysochromulina tobinii]|eukprot:KOO28561.1 hypothetical protein Ctob_005878 [Chrysochromulina sp. CCMP291]
MVDDECKKCRSMRPLLAAAATRVDASSTSAPSVYSCSATQIHPRLARSASLQHTEHGSLVEATMLMSCEEVGPCEPHVDLIR